MTLNPASVKMAARASSSSENGRFATKRVDFDCSPVGASPAGRRGLGARLGLDVFFFSASPSAADTSAPSAVGSVVASVGAPLVDGAEASLVLRLGLR